MKVLDRTESSELRSLVFALSDTPAKGASPGRVSEKARLPEVRVRKLLEKHSDYFVNIAGSGSYALNRFGPHKGDIRAIVESIDKEAVAASTRRRAAAVILFFAFILFVSAK